ncbi:hypothetical protein Rsub_10603 [Raphidocelis subcapitata]|uniref:Uncharacterized protein n=1 Tax=Raphidocelis subcapitata TaxID=307507 RepID=A0A2V0PJ51_9CHLO|nr:hypothetical protein Rsub_10603 [Raphidocelis subcapitata]|eukprot:GBF97930.1 hypothetical protein Rsub_10603 [Raphidocelis subcapitata]
MARSAHLAPAPAASRRGGALAAVACCLALAALAPRAAADATAFATTLALKGQDPAGCGQLEEPCCLARGARCGAAGLACLPLTGAQALRCHACGGEDQPACEGRKCDQGLTAVDASPVAICIAASRPIPAADADADAPGRGRGNGNGRGRGSDRGQGNDRGRADNARGQIIMGACSADADCKGKRTCAGGQCVACGGPGQPCCGAPQPCRKYGRGRGDLACVFSAAAGIGVCTSPSS